MELRILFVGIRNFRFETVFRRRILSSFFLLRSWKICIGIIGSGLIVFRRSGGGNIDACSGMNLGIERSFLWNKCFHRNFQLHAATPFPSSVQDFVVGIEYFSIPNSFIFYFYLLRTYTLALFCSTFTGRQRSSSITVDGNTTEPVGLCFQSCFSKIESRAETRVTHTYIYLISCRREIMFRL